MQSDSNNSALPAIIPPTPEHTHANGQHSNPPAVPYIKVNKRYLDEIADDAQRAVQAAFADHLFIREGRLVRLSTNEHGRPFVSSLIAPALRDRMAQSAKFVHITPCGRTLQRQSLYQGPARCALEAYVPRLITSPS